MKQKKLLLFSLITTALLVTVFAVSSVVGNGRLSNGLFRTSAQACEHAHVEHYDQTDMYVEHYACCNCHHAWLDAGLTQEVSENTTTDRDGLLRQYTVTYEKGEGSGSNYVVNNVI